MGLVRRHVLVVDDDARIRDSLVSALRDEGHTVTAAHNGRDGLERLRGARPPVDVVLLDLMMPVMSGWAFRLEQRADAAISHVPVVVLSADGSPQAAAIDAAAFLRKPFALERLLEVIDRVTDPAAQPLPAERTKQQASALQSLSAVLAHELANPLAYTLLNVDELVAKLPELDDDPRSAEELAQLAVDARQGARRIAETLEEIRRLASAPRDAALVSEDLGRAARQAVASLSDEARASVGFTPAEAALVVVTPAGWLEQIARSLLACALERGPAVHVRCERRGSEATLAIDAPKPPGRAKASIKLVLCNVMAVALGGRLALEGDEMVVSLPLAPAFGG
jgi:CheY-like chemotaxis protein